METKSEINLRVDIRIPEDYLPQINLRLNLYKRISSVESLDEIEKIREEIGDRFGPLPLSIENLLRYGIIKYLAQKIGAQSIDRVRKKIILKYHPKTSADLTRLTDLLERCSGSITPQGVMSFPLSGDEDVKVIDETISILKELSVI